MRKIAPDDPTRLYESDLMERITRAHPSEPFIVYIPMILGMMTFSFLKAPAPWYIVLGLAFAGTFVWTLIEYILHRFLFHFEATSDLGKRQMKLIHGIHHQFPNDAERLVIPPIFALGVIAIFFFMFLLLFQSLWVTIPFLAGAIAGYLNYDFTHYATHHLKQRTPWGKAQKRRHMLHHYKYPEACYGVSTGLWDWVFHTDEKAAEKAVAEGRMKAKPEGVWDIINNDIH